MIEPEDALKIIFENVPLMGTEKVPVHLSCGRVIAKTACSVRDVPLSDSSSMDGYALSKRDLSELPARLKVLGVIPAGADSSALSISRGECYRIMTGAHMPKGADTVVEWELTDDGRETVTVNQESKTNNVRPKADDLAAGEILDYTGRVITPFILARIVSAGVLFAEVYRRPKVAVISTGSEITNGFDPKKLIDSNSPAVSALLTEAGADVSYLGVAEDDEDTLTELFKEMRAFDMAVISGGISTGDFDYTAKAGERAGVKWLFRKVRQKPGKPLAFGGFEGKPVFSLPGNPSACLFCAFFYAAAAVKKMHGETNPERKGIKAVLGADTALKGGRVSFDRVKLELADGVYRAFPYRSQNSNLTSSVADCDGFIRLDGDRTHKTGEEVLVYVYG